ncbi:MAG TPA: GDSL-type esterase/lipase family protein [Candidatus Polarisedimenticolaceae bacterium]|nr:GDSL-type esterase/lipase family protein [Candidatus Polarisedimenticolaceae bacterium]
MRRLLPVLVVLGSALAALLLFEGVVRLFVRPSAVAWGRLGDRELPPLRLVPQAASPDFDPDLAMSPSLSQGDLCGIFREDPEIGYTWAPSRVSRHGWWRANALGARSETETTASVPPGKRRVLVFGDSFAAGTRLPGAQTWAARLQDLRPDLDVVNFGVDGYGMAQSYLLFRRVRARMDWDAVVFVFVPRHDLWRDVNVSRWAGDRWPSYIPMPRFVPAGGDLRLVPGPYPRGTDVYVHDWPEASPALRHHLQSYDRFYDPLLFESPPVVGRMVSWKLLAVWMAERRKAVKRRAVMDDLDGEAFTVCERLLLRAQAEAAAAGKKFYAVTLPADGEASAMRRDQGARSRWQKMVQHLRARGLQVVDLAPALVSAPAGDLDAGADGTHYGPRASWRIAHDLARALPDQRLRWVSRNAQISLRDSRARGVSVRLKL